VGSFKIRVYCSARYVVRNGNERLIPVITDSEFRTFEFDEDL
jgi:hypothetical protein